MTSSTAQAKPRKLKKRHERKLLRLDGVHAVGLSTEGGAPVIRVYAEPAVARSIPSTIDGIPVVIRSADGGFKAY
jgi:hypothetical protein